MVSYGKGYGRVLRGRGIVVLLVPMLYPMVTDILLRAVCGVLLHYGDGVLGRMSIAVLWFQYCALW